MSDAEQLNATSLRAFAQRTRTSPSTLRRLLEVNGAADPAPKYVVGLDGKRHPARRTDTSARDSRIRSLRAEGRSVRAIATAVGVSVGTVHRVVATKVAPPAE